MEALRIELFAHCSGASAHVSFVRYRIHVPFDSSRTADSLQVLAASLGGVERECGTIVESLSEHFQSLTAYISEILRLAEIASESIDAGAVPSIPDKVESLVQGVEAFVRGRLESSSAVLEVVKNEQELVGQLLRINAGNRSIAQEMRMLRVLTGMEVARLEDAGAGFQHLVLELEAASETVATTAREFSETAIARSRRAQFTQRKMAAALPRLRKQFQDIENQLARALTDVKLSVQELCACPAEFKTCVETVAAEISGVVSAIQSHDITRQQNQHVSQALANLAARLTSPDGGLNAREIALALRVQVLQVEHITRAMDAWSSQIDECLASILKVSQSRLERVAAMVLAQEKQLFDRLTRIEEIERECGNDNAELKEALSGLSSMLASVTGQSQIARVMRDRLQLLSFNSMIESRNLGGRIDVMLEISRNIVRIASRCCEMAEKSRRTQEEMHRLLDEAHTAIGSHNGEQEHTLRTARLNVVSVLSGLKTAAQSNAAHASEMGAWTAALDEQIRAARSMSHSLREVTAGIRRLMGELDSLQQEMQASTVGEVCDLATLESAYSQAYTTEIERSILRAALYGGALPAVANVSSGNDVELF